MNWRWIAVAAAVVLATIAMPGVAGADANREVQDVLEQGEVGVYAEDAATLKRSSKHLRIKVSVPTPASGTYVYPVGAVPGTPEVFTAWAFVFNYPDLCNGPCDGDDIGDTPAQGGVFNVDGVVADGSKMKLRGKIRVGEAPFAAAPLQSPSTAEVHVAIAPHGQFDPADPSQLTTPIGSPFCGCWWVAIFPADDDEDDDDDDEEEDDD